jgi:large subunit ribosomal protein L28
MSKECAITGKSSKMAGRYSNATRATQYNPCGKVRRKANLQQKKVFVPEVNKTFNLTLSTKAIRTIAKNGAYQTLKKAGIIKA